MTQDLQAGGCLQHVQGTRVGGNAGQRGQAFGLRERLSVRLHHVYRTFGGGRDETAVSQRCYGGHPVIDGAHRGREIVKIESQDTPVTRNCQTCVGSAKELGACKVGWPGTVRI